MVIFCIYQLFYFLYLNKNNTSTRSSSKNRLGLALINWIYYLFMLNYNSIGKKIIIHEMNSAEQCLNIALLFPLHLTYGPIPTHN